jgi:hypothetical protein
VCWKPCSSCWSFHLLREEFLSALIHSTLSGSPYRSFSARLRPVQERWRNDAGSRASLHRPHRAAPPATGWMRHAAVSEDASACACTGRAHFSVKPTPGLWPAEPHTAVSAPRRDEHPSAAPCRFLRLPDGHTRHVSQGTTAACTVRRFAP